MPELTANAKVALGIIAATAALFTGLLGNVLAENISALLSRTPPKTGKRPAVVWVAFCVSAALSVLAGSVATFAPAMPVTPAPTATLPPTPTPGPGTPTVQPKPHVVVTNVNSGIQREDTHTNLIICRDTVEFANITDIPTSLVSVGMELHIDNTVVQFKPADSLMTWSNSQYSVDVAVWKTGPDARKYSNARGLDQFAGAKGLPLPVLIGARSTGSAVVDFAVQGTSSEPTKITASHILRFPDISDVRTTSATCK